MSTYTPTPKEAFTMDMHSLMQHEIELAPDFINDWLDTFHPNAKSYFSKVFLEVLPAHDFDVDNMKGHKDYKVAVALSKSFLEFFHMKCQEQLPSGRNLHSVSLLQ
jgi:hypothetical protein